MFKSIAGDGVGDARHPYPTRPPIRPLPFLALGALGALAEAAVVLYPVDPPHANARIPHHSTDRSIAAPSTPERPTEKPTERLTDRPTERLTDRPTEKRERAAAAGDKEGVPHENNEQHFPNLMVYPDPDPAHPAAPRPLPLGKAPLGSDHFGGGTSSSSSSSSRLSTALFADPPAQSSERVKYLDLLGGASADFDSAAGPDDAAAAPRHTTSLQPLSEPPLAALGAAASPEARNGEI